MDRRGSSFGLRSIGRTGGRGPSFSLAAGTPSSARRRFRENLEQNSVSSGGSSSSSGSRNVNNDQPQLPNRRRRVGVNPNQNARLFQRAPAAAAPPPPPAPAAEGIRGRRGSASSSTTSGAPAAAAAAAAAAVLRGERQNWSGSSASAADADVSPPPASPPSPPSPEGASEQAMRLLKRMKPNELREISKAATALEKSKLEDSEKVAAFVAKHDNFVELVGDCYICLEPLLNNIGTTKFGVVSWRCRCTVPQKAHSGCIFSKICHGQSLCDMCHSPMEFEKTRRKGSQATIRFHREALRADPGDASSSCSSSDSSSSSSSSESGEDDDDDDLDVGLILAGAGDDGDVDDGIDDE